MDLQPKTKLKIPLLPWPFSIFLILAVGFLSAVLLLSIYQMLVSYTSEQLIEVNINPSHFADYSADSARLFLPPLSPGIIFDVIADDPDGKDEAVEDRAATAIARLTEPIPTATSSGAQITVLPGMTTMPTSTKIPGIATPFNTATATQQGSLPAQTATVGSSSTPVSTSTLPPLPSATSAVITASATSTLTPQQPTATQTEEPAPDTPEPTVTSTATVTATVTVGPTVTLTQTTTSTSSATAIPTMTPTPTQTASVTPTSSMTTTTTPGASATFTPTSTATPTPTLTAVVSDTPATLPPSATPTDTATPVACLPPPEGGLPAVADTYIDSVTPGHNNGSNPLLKIQSGRKWTFIRFDLSSIPQGSTVTSAVVYVNNNAGNSQNYTSPLYPITSDWDEMAVTFSTRPQVDTSWLAGVFIASDSNCSQGIDVDPALVQAWIDDPAANFGLALYPDERVSRETNLTSRENSSGGPLIVVAYDPPQSASNRASSHGFIPVTGPTRTPTPAWTATPARRDSDPLRTEPQRPRWVTTRVISEGKKDPANPPLPASEKKDKCPQKEKGTSEAASGLSIIRDFWIFAALAVIAPLYRLLWRP